ncbi:Restriction of telomere capping protein 5 [Ophidiomyces ophidiicola]|nr:Restriction of telomere capping protein 5 [Ophidiomyces ophidiicola]
MGTGSSKTAVNNGPSPDELSKLLANRFAAKCFTPLELTHFKDNFDSQALHENEFYYWNEEILSRFLGIPDGAGEKASADTDTILDAGPVIFRMVSYLGAFPFQNTMAPSVLTYEAILKVVVLLTERYGRVLRRGKGDRVKLLFGSLADVGRVGVKSFEDAQNHKDNGLVNGDLNNTHKHTPRFDIDAPANDEDEDDNDDDDDDLALTALESLDATEVFKYDQRINRNVYKARISVGTFRRLLALLLVIAPLHPLGTTACLIANHNGESIDTLQAQIDSILAAFGDNVNENGISYRTFSDIITTSLPYLFDPLTPLFEHFLFSKNLDLSRKKKPTHTDENQEQPSSSSPLYPANMEPIFLPGTFEPSIMNLTLLSHISFFLSTSSPIPNLFRNSTRLHPVFSSIFHGESLTAFSHHVLTWQAPSLLIIKGEIRSSNNDTVLLGAYLPEPWKKSTRTPSRRISGTSDACVFPCLFQLLPTHTVLQANPFFKSLKSNMPVVSFSTNSGIALGCVIPPTSRTSLNNELQPRPSGGGSLIIDPALENAKFIVSEGVNRDGVFLSPSYSHPPPSSLSTSAASTTTCISIHSMEVWGIVPSQADIFADLDPEASKDAVAMQRTMWNFEAKEAERRRTIHLKVGGGDSEAQSGRALLEMAGIIGDGHYHSPRRQ